MLAVSQNGAMLEHAAPVLRGDQQVALHALRSAGRVLHYAAIELKASVDVRSWAATQSCGAWPGGGAAVGRLRRTRRNLKRTLLEGAVELKEDPEILNAMAEQQSSLDSQAFRVEVRDVGQFSMT